MRLFSVLFFTILLNISVFAYSGGGAKPLAENFSAASLDGTIVNLADLRGKVVVISFWTTRCAI